VASLGRPTAQTSGLLRAVAAGVGLLLAIAIAEAGVRLVTPLLAQIRPDLFGTLLPFPYRMELDAASTAGRSFGAFDRELGWVNAPEYGADDPSWSYRHNRAGMRADRDYTPIPRPGIRRIAAYGDSFTYCSEVGFRDCWTRELTQRLPNTEVLNFGVGGYGPDQAWLLYKRNRSVWRSCAVLIGHMVENTARVVNRYRPFLHPGQVTPLAKPRFLRIGDGLVLLPSPASRVDDLKDPVWVETNLGSDDRWYFPGLYVANPLDRLEVVRLTRTLAYLRAQRAVWIYMYQPGSEPFDITRDVLVEFASDVRADGVVPLVVVFQASGRSLNTYMAVPRSTGRCWPRWNREGFPP
jgi:hypothetical protein